MRSPFTVAQPSSCFPLAALQETSELKLSFRVPCSTSTISTWPLVARARSAVGVRAAVEAPAPNLWILVGFNAHLVSDFTFLSRWHQSIVYIIVYIIYCACLCLNPQVQRQVAAQPPAPSTGSLLYSSLPPPPPQRSLIDGFLRGKTHAVCK